jgi:hypothetical protein
MRINILIFNIIVILASGLLYSQEVKDEVFKTNLDIYAGLINRNLGNLDNQIVLLGKDKVYSINVKGKKQESEYLYTIIKQKFYNYRIISEMDSASSDYKIYFDNLNLETKYNKVSGSVLKNKMVVRQIEVSYKCSIRQKGSESEIYNNSIRDKSSDEFYLEKLSDAERGEYDFLKGTLPSQSFFEKALIPGIVILASAVTIISFFAIRSK